MAASDGGFMQRAPERRFVGNSVSRKVDISTRSGMAQSTVSSAGVSRLTFLIVEVETFCKGFRA